MLTLDEVKQYLRVDSSDEDTLIESLITAAGSLVTDVSRKEELDPSQELIKMATLYTVAYLYEHREKADYHELTLTLRSLLFGVREVKF